MADGNRSEPDPPPALHAYADLLRERAIPWGLLGPREADRIWDRHIRNSLALVELVPQGSSVVDVGSGAGLPGLPLAIARQDLTVTLLEPMLRRTNFLAGVVDELGLEDRVRVVRGRAEQHRAPYDVVVARAVAPLDRLVRWCRAMMGTDGTLLALKGRTAADEVHAAQGFLAAEGLRADVLELVAARGDEPTRIIRVR